LNTKGSPNIYDIAQSAGVSIATVSRVLAGGHNVSARTEKKVLSVMEALHYTPNAFARGLCRGSMGMVGVLCTDVSDLYYAKAVSTLERLLRQKGLDALLCCTGEKLEDKKKSLSLLLGKHVDAAILIGSAFKEQDDNSHIEAAARSVPVVVINGWIDCENTYCILCDEETAMFDAVSALCRCGCRRILYLYDQNTFSGARKLAGYRRALHAQGIEPDEGLIQRVEKSLDEVRVRVDQLLSAGIAMDGIAASEDLLAIGAMQPLHAHGLHLPVIGFNNSTFAEIASPTLTSVDNMVETLCTTAFGILCDVLEGRSAPRKVVLSAQLIERETFRTSQTTESCILPGKGPR
jgi:LacI family transcriptional regulator